METHCETKQIGRYGRISSISMEHWSSAIPTSLHLLHLQSELEKKKMIKINYPNFLKTRGNEEQSTLKL